MRRRAAMWADPEWLVYIQKLDEFGYLVEQKTSLMIPAKFCADQALMDCRAGQSAFARVFDARRAVARIAREDA